MGQGLGICWKLSQLCPCWGSPYRLWESLLWACSVVSIPCSVFGCEIPVLALPVLVGPGDGEHLNSFLELSHHFYISIAPPHQIFFFCAQGMWYPQFICVSNIPQFLPTNWNSCFFIMLSSCSPKKAERFIRGWIYVIGCCLMCYPLPKFRAPNPDE